jgi:hypothetical protein
MTSLEWAGIVEAFFKFRAEADKFDFYREDLDRMEQSIMDMRPIRGLEFKDVLSTREEYSYVAPSV